MTNHASEDRADTPSFSNLPDKPRLEIDGQTLYDIKDAAALTGLTVRTLQVYGSHRRCSRYLGPKPTKLPGTNRVFYTTEDLTLYLKFGHTGAPGEPNGDDLRPEVK